MRKYISTFALSSFLLSGCSATRMPDSEYSFTQNNGGYNLSQVPQVLATAISATKTQSDMYRSSVSDERQWARSFDSSIIALAAASVASAFFGGTPDLIGGLGLGASTLTNYRDSYNNAGRRDAFERGYHALDCVAERAAQLQAATPQSLETARQELEDALIAAKAAAANPNSGNNKAAQDAATSAISAGEAALTALDGEIAAYIQSPQTVNDTSRSIVEATEKATDYKSVDYNAVQTSLTTAINTATTNAGTVEAAKTKLIEAIKGTAKAQAIVPNSAAKEISATNKAELQLNLATNSRNATQQTVSYAAGLNNATERALFLMRPPTYSSVTASIVACSAT